MELNGDERICCDDGSDYKWFHDICDFDNWFACDNYFVVDNCSVVDSYCDNGCIVLVLRFRLKCIPLQSTPDCSPCLRELKFRKDV